LFHHKTVNFRKPDAMSKDNTALLVRLFRRLPREAIKSLIAKGKYDFRLKKLSSEDHFLCLLIGQVAGCHSLRELEHFLKVSDGRLQRKPPVIPIPLVERSG
jgi:hypothetical protein